jgi:uncharacterized protein YyaL (SSP411 family)
MSSFRRIWSVACPALIAWVGLLGPSMISCARASNDERVASAEAGPEWRMPPGARPYSAGLVRRLERALAAKGSDYEPRTHHRNTDGSPVYTNRLILEASPYLHQHAHNPVDWFAWGDEAFARARELDRPILLSVGYSTCHWCHVMERESFEDPEIARFMDEHFVAIKVDREERPDVDNVYMSAVRMLSGSAGWPMTVVLTPDLEPYFGGTYFPARSGDRGARIGFWEVLHQVEQAYRTDRAGVVSKAAGISRRVAQALAGSKPGDVPGALAIATGAAHLAQSYDPAHGGFGRSRKFPRPATLQMLLRFHRRTGDPQALVMVEATLEKMANGGIHDQVGGGFHRYTVEPTWLIPHFEKMLYDNAQLGVIYLEAHQATGRGDFAEVARRILDYVAREMTAPGGGFYSATDADSPSPSGHDEEGWFFTWTPGEIRAVVGAELAPIVLRHFGVDERGNFEGRTILRDAESIERLAGALGKPASSLRRDIERARVLLYEARLQRPPPHTDTKIITAWNGLMISAFARGALILDDDEYRERASRAVEFLFAHVRKGDRLFRSYADGRPGGAGVLSDYAFMVAGLLDLFETTSEPRWLQEALTLQRALAQHFWDQAAGGFYMTADDSEKLLARDKPSYDGAEPSGNSVALLNLLRLYEITGDHDLRRKAEKALASFSRTMRSSPSSVPLMLSALDYYLDRPKQVVLMAGKDVEEARPFLDRLAGRFVPNRVLVAAVAGDEGRRLRRLTPLLEERTASGGVATAYVCVGRVCELPTTDPEVFDRQIAKVSPYEGYTPAPLVPAAAPRPWEYDEVRGKHWHPGHGHWHDGRPPPQDQRQ